MGLLRFLFFLVVVAFGTETFAGDYQVNVTRKGANLYAVTGKDIYIFTRYCYAYVYYEDSLLKMLGYSGEIIFLEAEETCDVKAVYGKMSLEEGTYKATVTQESDDWYEVLEFDGSIKTSGCLSLALGEEAILEITPSGTGTLYVDDEQCMVEGVFSKLRL